MGALVAECRFQLGLGGVPQVYDVFRVVTQNIDHEGQECIGVVVREIDLGQAALVGLVADDHRYAVGVGDFGVRRSRRGQRQHSEHREDEALHG